MLKPYTRALPIAAALAFVASAAMAESTSQGTVPHTTTTIGVTPQDAQEAMEKASPNAETGTLVRTEPSAEKRARSLTKDATTTHTTPATPANKAKNHTTPRPAGIPANKTTGTVTNTTTPNAAMGITGTVPGADDTTGDVTNTHDNAQKNKDRATGAPADADAMGNHRSSPPSKP